MRVVCIMRQGPRYESIANAMYKGIRACGDAVEIVGYDRCYMRGADVGVMYGWKFAAPLIGRFKHFVYFDLGFWNRHKYYRVSVDGWSQHGYVMQGKDDKRLRSIGIEPLPWNEGGTDILIVGAKRKSSEGHGIEYMAWERGMAERLRNATQRRLVFRPKPSDPEKRPISGCVLDKEPLIESLRRCSVVLSHHSNVSIDALVAGVPTYCEFGAAKACSIKFEEIDNPPRLEHRLQFLNDVAWLQWSLPEMSDGSCWMHLKERGLLS